MAQVKRRNRFNLYMGFNQWFELCEEGKVPKGCSKHNVKLLSAMKEEEAIAKRNSVLTFYCLTQLKIENMRTMLESLRKQKDVYRCAIITLKNHIVDNEWAKYLEINVEKIHERNVRIFTIVKENLKLTEYYPYLEQVGFEKLLDFELGSYVDERDELKVLFQEFENWKSDPDNARLVEEHMKSVQEEIDAYEQHKEKIKQMSKDEKMQKRLAKKIADDEVKEIKKNKKMHQNRERLLAREFDRLYCR